MNMLPFLSLKEQTCLQGLNGFFYCVAVSRVATRLELVIPGRQMLREFGNRGAVVRTTGYEFDGRNLTMNIMGAKNAS